MGPDCGTAIINGVPLGFANVVRRGDIGLVAASGTGLQEVTCRIHNLGGGVSQALGTGGRDLKEEIGGITMLQGLAALADDPDTRVIVLISKPPAPAIARRIEDAAGAAGKPVVIHFLGAAPERMRRRRVRAPARCARRPTSLSRSPAASAPPSIRGSAGRRRARLRRTARGSDGTDANGRARAVHRRHVLLRGAAGVHRARAGVQLERAGQGRRDVRRPLRRPCVPRPRRRRLHARAPAPDDRPAAARRGSAHAGRRSANGGDPVRRRAGLRLRTRIRRAGWRRPWQTRSARRAHRGARSP